MSRRDKYAPDIDPEDVDRKDHNTVEVDFMTIELGPAPLSKQDTQPQAPNPEK